jgi:signal transduction histidine kinase
VFAAVAAATAIGGALTSRVASGRREDAAAVAHGWRTMTVLEEARSVLIEAEAACGRSAQQARCAAMQGEVERIVAHLGAATAGRPDRRQAVARIEAALRAYVGTPGRRTQARGARARRAEAEGALAALRESEARELGARERAAERSTSVAAGLVVATDVAILLLVAIAALSLRGHLRERELHEHEHARVVQLQQQLLAMVGHDLRTPLSAIAGSAALLARAPDLPSSRLRLAQRIVSSAGRMSRLVSDLLDFTRVRTEGRLPVSPEPVNLGALCRRVVQEIAAARPRTIVHCEVEGDVTGEWDPARVEQVVSNLVTNACLHGDAERPVLVRVTGLDDAVRIAVHNEGPPIPPEVLPHIFEPFRRGDEHVAGLGLGLHIVQTLVEAHGGTVEVSSDESGTTFTVVLPAPVVTPVHRSDPPRASAH